MASSVEKGVHYPIADEHGIKVPASLGDRKDIRAKWNGEFRSPKKGEFYLSGAIVEAYDAKNDLPTQRFHIAELVNMKEAHWVVTRDGKPVAVCASADDADRWLMRHQGMSPDWSKEYEGYAITEVNNNASE